MKENSWLKNVYLKLKQENRSKRLVIFVGTSKNNVLILVLILYSLNSTLKSHYFERFIKS